MRFNPIPAWKERDPESSPDDFGKMKIGEQGRPLKLSNGPRPLSSKSKLSSPGCLAATAKQRTATEHDLTPPLQPLRTISHCLLASVTASQRILVSIGCSLPTLLSLVIWSLWALHASQS